MTRVEKGKIDKNHEINNMAVNRNMWKLILHIIEIL